MTTGRYNAFKPATADDLEESKMYLIEINEAQRLALLQVIERIEDEAHPLVYFHEMLSNLPSEEANPKTIHSFCC